MNTLAKRYNIRSGPSENTPQYTPQRVSYQQDNTINYVECSKLKEELKRVKEENISLRNTVNKQKDELKQKDFKMNEIENKIIEQQNNHQEMITQNSQRIKHLENHN